MSSNKNTLRRTTTVRLPLAEKPAQAPTWVEPLARPCQVHRCPGAATRTLLLDDGRTLSMRESCRNGYLGSRRNGAGSLPPHGPGHAEAVRDPSPSSRPGALNLRRILDTWTEGCVLRVHGSPG